MRETNPILKNTASHLNSLLAAVILGYILEPGILQIYIPRNLWASPFGPAFRGGLIILKVLFYCGIYGGIVDVVSGKKRTLSRKGFFDNVKSFWKIYVFLVLVTVLLHFSAFVLFPGWEVSYHSFSILSDIFILYILAWHIIFRKFVKGLDLPKRKIEIGKQQAFTLAAIILIEIFFLKILDWGEASVYIQRLVFFVLRYCHFFLFLFYSLVILRQYPEIKKKFSSEKEIYLVNPLGSGAARSLVWKFFGSYPPIFSVLKALTPDGFSIREFNRVIWRDHYYEGNKLVAITSFSSNTPEAYKIAKEFKKRGSKVVMGGAHVTFVSAEALEFCDSVVVGDAEGVWEDVVRDYEDGKLKPIYYGQQLDKCYEKVNKKLITFAPLEIAQGIETGRGCKYACDFCVIPAICDGKIRKRPLQDVLALIRRGKEQRKTFYFLDNNIYADKQYAQELFEALKPLSIKWAASSSIDIAKDEKMVTLAKESGCFSLLIGYEITDVSGESSKKGKFALAREYRALTRIIKKKGIGIKGHLIFGFDSDSWRSLFDMWKFCFSIFPSYTVISCLAPYPGSKHFSKMAKEDRLTNLNWHNYEQNKFVFKTKGFDAAVFTAAYPIIYGIFFLTTSKVGAGFLVVWILLVILF